MAAEHAVRLFQTRVLNGAAGDFVRETQPARVEPISQAGKIFASEIKLLKFQVQQCSQTAEEQVSGNEAVELVTVNGKMLLAGELPCVFLINPDTNKVRHHSGETAVVIALDPNHFDLPLGVRQLAYQPEKFPVVFGQATEIEV